VVDPKQRAELDHQVGRLAHDLAVNIPLPSQQAFIVTRDNLEGVYYNPMLSGAFLWKDIQKK
jgi:peptide/nickel transport system substrate-binding protein